MFKMLFFVLFTVLPTSYSESYVLQSPQKCGIKDSECIMQLSEFMVDHFAEHGIAELGIPGLDPMHVKDQSVSVIGLVNITLVEGIAEGMKDCKVKSFNTGIDEKIAKFNIFCDVFTIKGIYNVKSDPLIDRLLGSFVSGEGNGSVVMEKLVMNFTYPFNVEKHEDGDIYLVPDVEKAEYSYEILDKVTFTADSILLGSLQIAPMVTSFLTRNWMYVMSSFGRLFSDRGFAIGNESVKKFFNFVPAKNYITDDLSQYLTN